MTDKADWDRLFGDSPLVALPTREDDLGAIADGYRPTDIGNAARLVATGQGRIRYVRAWGRWLAYRDGVWIIDTKSVLVTELAKDVPEALFQRSVKLAGDARDAMWKHAKTLEKAAAISAMVKLAAGDEDVLVEHDQLDTHPMLLNVRNGTIDLATGRIHAHDPAHLLTMQAPVTYEPDAAAPLFAKCLERWQPDPEVRAYLQRVIGSAATGHPVEALFVNHGGGGNGKGKFYGAIGSILGPYYVIPHMSLLVAGKHQPHPTHIASLFRARMIVAGETSQGDRLDEAQVKNLTGGDLLSARRMREDEWKFAPTHTTFLHTNHRPRIHNVDEGIWRRVRLIPWTVTIPQRERDEQLADKLAAEAPGILNWIVAGAVDYLTHGLDEPPAVRSATAAYRAESDALGRFLDDRIQPNPNAHVRARELFDAWQQWCRQNGEQGTSEPEFAKDMTARGHDKKPTKVGRIYPGLMLLSDQDEEAPDDPWGR